MRPAKRLIQLILFWLFVALLSALSAILESAFESFPILSAYLYEIWLWGSAISGSLLFFDLLSLKESKHVSASRKVTKNLAVGATTTVSLKINNRSNRILNIFVSDHYPQHSEVKDLPQTVTINTGSFAELYYKIRILHRGDAEFGLIRLLIQSTLGLWEKVIQDGTCETIKVYPNFAAIHDYILLSADQQSSQMGIRLSQRRGDGLEFHQLREYRIGDSLRQIDWRASSRLNKLISKEYQEEKDQNIVFLLDCGRRMRTQDQDLSHFDHSLNAMLLLAYIGLKQGDAVGFLSFGGISRWLSPQKGTHFINMILNQVYDCHPTLNASDFIEAATELNSRIRKRSLVVLITNCRDEDLFELEPAIKLLNEHHLVMLANLREHALDESIENPVANFEDALKYTESLNFIRQRQKVQNQCVNRGVIALDTIPSHLASRIVNSYFEIKRSGRL
ncbi:DUF58 domain-containing protein [Pleionea sediminis]|uniref:DUF58 domain-containing protein n=1 Tax=Pleionea sediminis TaxID=2569479 RepID=UPI001186EED9|nr:DUF58 domain-containing protein [Pleionea sediminis]